MNKNKPLTPEEERDYRILDIKIKAGIAFTIATAVIIWLVLLLNK